MTRVTLWAAGERFDSLALLGKPVWQRTKEAVDGLKLPPIRWVGKGGAAELTKTTLAETAKGRGTVLLVPANLPCLTTRSLKRLLSSHSKTPSSSPRALFPSKGGAPRVVVAHARVLDNIRPATFEAVCRALTPEPVFTDDDDLLVVDSAAAWGEAHRILRTRKLDALIRRGVLVPDPGNVCVDPEVSVSAGAMLSPWVRLEGNSRVGKDCTIGSFSHLVNATVGAGTVILDHCFIRESRIGKNASVGPFTHLRPAADVGDRARVGNFVELKKSTLGAGAKVSHLAYVGDATLGKDANLGAGTITCNYDGKTKNRTIVGDGAFIGSDVQLVAPVRVGKGAFVAAGSCIVDDVPPHSLALARSRQVVKKNWAKNRNKR